MPQLSIIFWPWLAQWVASSLSFVAFCLSIILNGFKSHSFLLATCQLSVAFFLHHVSLLYYVISLSPFRWTLLIISLTPTISQVYSA